MKRMYKESKFLVGYGVFSGVGADVITRTGGDAQSIVNLSRYTPTMGTISGSSAVIRQLRRL